MLLNSRIKKLKYAIIVAFFSFQSHVLSAVAATVLCPESLKVTESVLEVEADWEVIIDPGRRAYMLDGVRIYIGHPNQMGSLAPDSVLRDKELQKTTWHFPSSGSDKYWIACSYRNTKLLAIKKLDPEIKSCQVAEQLLPSGALLKLKSVLCQ
jgi:hypothetical protein